MARSLELRPYQDGSIERLRIGARDGHRAQLLMIPTGGGKTIVAVSLVKSVVEKMARAAFVVDRVSLVDQTSATFDEYGIPHGVMQSSHWRCRPYERIQVCSVQTLARRGFPEGLELIIIDECHVQHKSVIDFIKANPRVRVIGLSATPFTKGMAKTYTNLVNVVTQEQLISEGWLCPIKAYAAIAPDMTGAKVKFNGEWDEREIDTRCTAIVGDIVSEWLDKTNKHFGKAVKTIVFSASVAHGEELCAAFGKAGFRFEQVSYKDTDDEARRALIEEFRKPDSDITGLISCEALSKGFDVTDILCGIGARPYRKSLSSHIQQVGRVMRPHPGKEFALWLDHAGNWLRFRDDTEDVASNGLSELDDGKALDAKVRKEPPQEDIEQHKCGDCKFIMPKTAKQCPMCGWERPRRASMHEQIDGHMIEVSGKATAAKHAWQQDKAAVWAQMCGYAINKYDGDLERAERFAKANYMQLYQTWPAKAMRNIEAVSPSKELANWFRHKNIAYVKAIRKLA